jgi:DNA-binding MarR family transcriptional regulator
VDAERLRADIGLSLVRFIASAVLHNHVVTGRLGLGASDAQFMNLLNLHGPLSPGRLAELSGLTTGTVTGVIDRLERSGYVRRDRDPSDRRKVVVTPVPEALAAMAEHYRGHGEHVDALLRRRSPDQLRVIAEFLAELTGSGAEAAGSPPPSWSPPSTGGSTSGS